MPRRQFVADLQKAVEGVSIAGISDVQTGNDDGEFTFQCLADGEQLQISALIPELSDYPSCHMCMVFGPDNASSSVASALSDISDSATGKSVLQLLELVSRKLESTDTDGDQQMLDSQELDDFDEEDDDDDEEDYFPDDDLIPKPVLGSRTNSSSLQEYTKPSSEFRHRIRSDLMIAKANGFKIGHLGSLLDGLGCFVSVSCRISKLGISEEAMQAWQVSPSEYLVVILQFPNGYKSMDSMKSYDAVTARRNFNIRVGISTTYKPTMQEAVRAFTVLSKDDENRRGESQSDSQNASVAKGFRNSFISRPLNELLEQRFPILLQYRYSNGMPWHGAEAFYNDNMGAQHAHAELGLHDKYMEPEAVSTAYPSLVTADHIEESLDQNHSLPLIAMQFVLRHFVRCTEFCLICFSKMPDDLQAIKPYVCDNPLCLYQYMSLGFGPSIEHEILSQPKVVDLLVSFCYTTARSGALKTFPSGLSLMVPPTSAYESDYTNMQHQHNYRSSGVAQQPPTQSTVAGAEEKPHVIKYNAETREILFSNRHDACPVRSGDWILLRAIENPGRALHCRVVETSLYPTIRVSEPVVPVVTEVQQPNYAPYAHQQSSAQKWLPDEPPILINEFRQASFHVYNQNFDDMPDYNKRQTIFALLDLLPSIEDMKQFLLRRAQSSLSNWVDRLSPATLGLLRWIIASNRACIVQVEEDDEFTGERKSEDRLSGMQGWTQFRFAMGAPDKERRFIQAVRDTTDRLHLKYPTLFAWHGSPLQNWHSIIREGLHFKDTAHGRAYGHGVYHSLEVNTSIGYSQYGGHGSAWPMSELKVSQALALNEIVNAPKEYVSSNPHLVVAQLDWIQTRYLFIKSGVVNYGAPVPTTKEAKPLESIEQDPNMTPRGVQDKLTIPIYAISGSRRPKSRSTMKNKRQKSSGSSVFNPIEIDIDDDTASVTTLEEDRIILEDEDVYQPRLTQSQMESGPLPTPNSTKGKKSGGFFAKWGSKFSSASSSKPLTDYVPGTLDYETLPMLQQPSWASTSATKCLMRDFKSLIQVQQKELPHELGWHIDEDKIENMYQWIVELHSFDPTLPLAKDMKSKGHKSIVLELRFGKDYPMTPPFVRVIRPRFLGFNQGGGGHVTAGGAMCMQLLTNDGWSAVSSIESVLLQVRMAMSSLDPAPARLENGTRSDYGVGEAIDAYIRACNVHGWTVPTGFKEMAYGGTEKDPMYPTY